jgi:hypothetical protein
MITILPIFNYKNYFQNLFKNIYFYKNNHFIFIINIYFFIKFNKIFIHYYFLILNHNVQNFLNFEHYHDDNLNNIY